MKAFYKDGNYYFYLNVKAKEFESLQNNMLEAEVLELGTEKPTGIRGFIGLAEKSGLERSIQFNFADNEARFLLPDNALRNLARGGIYKTYFHSNKGKKRIYINNG